MFKELEIKQINIEDYKLLKDIIKQQQWYHYNLNGPYSESFLKINEINFQKYMMKKKLSMTYVAVVNNTIIGFSSAYINNHEEGFVEDLFVTDDFRNKTIGSKLFQKILKWLEEYHARTVDIHISIGNESALKFYEKNGFKTTGYTMKKQNIEEQKATDK